MSENSFIITVEISNYVIIKHQNLRHFLKAIYFYLCVPLVSCISP